MTGLLWTDQINGGKREPGGAFEQAAAKRIPAGRLGEPEEFAGAPFASLFRRISSLCLGLIFRGIWRAAMAVFLASDRASYINGVAVNVDGGSSPSL